MTGGCEWSHDRKRALRFEKSQLVVIETWARPDEFVRYGRCALVGLRADDVKAVSIERLCLSLPYVEKPLNSKVIKSFVPELRSRKCFSCFGIPMLSTCALWTLWTFCVPVWICTFHIFLYGYVTTLAITQRGLPVFHSVYSVLVYHGYINAIKVSRTGLNFFQTSKQPLQERNTK